MVLISSSRVAYAKGPDTSSERVEIGVVTGVAQDGTVKQWSSPFMNDDETPPSRYLPKVGLSKVMIVHKEDIDVEGAVAAYRARRWPNTQSRAVRPLESVEQARVLLRPFLIGGTSGEKG